MAGTAGKNLLWANTTEDAVSVVISTRAFKHGLWMRAYGNSGLWPILVQNGPTEPGNWLCIGLTSEAGDAFELAKKTFLMK